MRLSAIRALSIAVIVACLAGCQSGPRWAWWKPQESSEDKSLVARSAPPTLPSAQSTPQVAESGTQPAVPPSSANLAAAGTQPPLSASSIPATSAATLANAPLANYPSANLSAETSAATPPVAPAVPGATSVTMPATVMPSNPPQMAAASVPAAGPYDPHAYQPSAAVAATPPVGEAPSSPDRYTTPVADRYAAAPSNASSTMATPSADRTAMPVETPAGAPAESDRYGQSLPDRYASQPATPAAPLPSTTTPAPYAAAVQVSVPAGQYRPGGTSSYTSGPASQQVEVASRPAPPTSTNVPPETAEPAPVSVPWTPPVTSAPEAGAETRTY